LWRRGPGRGGSLLDGRFMGRKFPPSHPALHEPAVRRAALLSSFSADKTPPI